MALRGELGLLLRVGRWMGVRLPDVPRVCWRQLEIRRRECLFRQASEETLDNMPVPVLLQHAGTAEEESVPGMIQDFSQREDFTIEIETTPVCNLDCPWCENRRKETSGSLAG